MMPAWTQSVRFRLAIVYSAIVFGLGALIVAAVYFGLSSSLRGEPVTQDLVISRFRDLGGPFVAVEQRVVRNAFINVERLVNQRTLDKMRDISLLGLAMLFPVSVLVGWLVAGRVLRPIGRITSVAREIQTTDLSRRIELAGPDDELRQLADTFDDMLDRIEAGAEAQRVFIHETSHELRNPLAVMATNLDVVLADESASQEDLRQAAGVVRRSIDRITHTVEDLLSYARRDVPVTRSEPVDVSRIVDEAKAEFGGPAAERQLTMEIVSSAGSQPSGDTAAIRQAYQNIVGNAVRLAPLGSTIRLGSGERDGWIWLAVADEGPGIPAAEQPLVWQRYWRGRGQETAGSGLGLAIVRQVAESHGGTVQLDSELGSGSTFVMWLPRTRPPAGPIPIDTPELAV